MKPTRGPKPVAPRRAIRLANFGGEIHAYDRDPADPAARLLATTRRQAKGAHRGYLVRRADGGAESWCSRVADAKSTLIVYARWMLDHPALIPAATIAGPRPTAPAEPEADAARDTVITGAALGDLSPARSHIAAIRLVHGDAQRRHPAATTAAELTRSN